MTPQLVDLNGDGHKDMITATFEGMVSLVEGSDKGWKKPVHIKDKKDSELRISFFWSEKEMNFLDWDRSTEDYENVEYQLLTSVAAVDWDADGDQDLLLGAKEGALYLCMNEGTSTKPEFSEKNLQVKIDDEPVVIAGGMTTPRVVDWDGDGKFDILCGSSRGGVYLLRNVGEEGKPAFAEKKKLVSRISGYQPHTGMPRGPSREFYFEVVDYDKDGDLDLLVGGISHKKPKAKRLNAEQKEQLAELEKKQSAIEEEMNAAMKALEGDDEAISDLMHSKEFLDLGSKMSSVMEEIQELKPRVKEVNSIWVFRNKKITDPNAEQRAKRLALAASEAEKNAGNEPEEMEAEEAFEPAEEDLESGESAEISKEELDRYSGKVAVDAPTAKNPVTYAARAFHFGTVEQNDMRIYAVMLKFRIHDGWKLYSKVPDGGANTAVSIAVEKADGLWFGNPWSRSPAKPSEKDSKLEVWKNECVFLKYVTADAGTDRTKPIKLSIEFQTCNEDLCRPVVSKTIEVMLEDKKPDGKK